MKSKLVTPHASVLVWSYDDRVNSDGGTKDVHAVEQVIIGTSSIISISTSKRKSAPAGQFELRLAPRFNWVSRITPGSWCAILMSQNPINDMAKGKIGLADKNSFKMLGRIDSVRGSVEVNQETGARSTIYVVTGMDWGSVFDSILYIDQAVSENILKGSAIAQSYAVLGLNSYKTYADSKTLPTSTDLVDSMLNLWGLGAGTAISNGEAKIKEEMALRGSDLLLSTQTQFQLPKEVAQFMRQGKTIFGKPLPGTTAVNFAEIINRKHGRLKGPHDYEDPKESFGIPAPDQFLGAHSLWQLLTDNCNSTLYELVTDIDWSSGQPKFTLYHRIKPFVARNNFMLSFSINARESDALMAESTVKSIASPFKYVKRASIDLEDVVSVNFGTNWRDKINFIEVRSSSQLLKETQGVQAKLDGQTLDRVGYQRDGFKPYFATSSFLPIESGAQLRMDKLSHWKFLLREWYFNTHMLLNGSMTCIGQNQYIQVGDNIMVDSTVLGPVPFNTKQKTSKQSFLLAHVENIRHNFTVNQETGARTFTTTIEFVRGIIADSAGNTIAPIFESGAIDRDASSLEPLDERDQRVFGTSVESDPDIQKLNKGKLT